VSLRRIVTWTLRVAAWTVVAAPVVRLIVDPTRVWLDGRILQMHLAGERRHASAALMRELKLDRHLSPLEYPDGIYDIANFRTPHLLGIGPGVGYSSDTACIWLEPDGTHLLPALRPRIVSNPPEDAILSTGRARLPRRRGQALFALIVGESSWNDFEWHETRVWIHRDDRWVNVLRFQGRLQWPDEDAAISSLTVRGEPDRVIPWSPQTEQFDVPGDLPDEIRILEPFPDQVWQP